MGPDAFNAKLQQGASSASPAGTGATTFRRAVNTVSGDLEVMALPVELGGSMTESYEHLNFLLFWSNIRQNVARRVQAKLS